MKDVLILQSDAERIPLDDQSVDLVVTSSPYADARLYLEGGKDLGVSRDCTVWIEWMLRVVAECCRVSRGLVILNCAGVTRDWCYWPAPEGLLYEWWKRGGQCWRPTYWYRVGIPGSGGEQWLRADVEYCLAFKGSPGRLPFADNTANGHPPKWGPGGEVSNRVSSGKRVNQWGRVGGPGGMGMRRANGTKGNRDRPSHAFGGGGTSFGRKPNGEKIPPAGAGPFGNQPSGARRRLERGNEKGGAATIPVLANPGTLIEPADEHGNLLRANVGGGAMGHPYSHENEAPYPIDVPAFFIRGWSKPGGIVLDPFSGSGTTADAALQLCRRAITCDLRMSQCKLTERRLLNPPEKVKAYKRAEAMKAEDERDGQTLLF